MGSQTTRNIAIQQFNVRTNECCWRDDTVSVDIHQETNPEPGVAVDITDIHAGVRWDAVHLELILVRLLVTTEILC
jgi:hypothetical protein